MCLSGDTTNAEVSPGVPKCVSARDWMSDGCCCCVAR